MAVPNHTISHQGRRRVLFLRFWCYANHKPSHGAGRLNLAVPCPITAICVFTLLFNLQRI